MDYPEENAQRAQRKVNVLYSAAENSEMIKAVMEFAKYHDKPTNCTRFWEDFKKLTNSEREVKSFVKRFREKLSYRMQNSTKIEQDLKIRMLFVMNCPITEELLAIMRKSPIHKIHVDSQRQILTFENLVTGLKLSAFDEQGHLPTTRRYGRRVTIRRATDLQETENNHDKSRRKRKYNKKSIDDIIDLDIDINIEHDAPGAPEAPEVSETPQYQDYYYEEYQDALTPPTSNQLALILKNETPVFHRPESPSSSNLNFNANLNYNNTDSMEIADFYQHFKYLVLSIAAPQLAELKKEINEAIRSLEQFQKIPIKNLLIILKSTLNFIICSSEPAGSSSAHFSSLKDFLTLFQLMVNNLEIPEFSGFAKIVQDKMEEHGKKKIAISKVKLSLQNVIEMISTV